MESLGCQSLSLTSTIQISLKSLDSTDTSRITPNTGIDSQLEEKKHTQGCLLSTEEKCDGVMGVPITFLEKYNPDQFEILGLANSARYLGDYPCYTVIDGEKIYNRILIRRRRKQ